MVTITGGDKLDKYLKDLAAKVEKGRALRVGFLEEAKYPDGMSVATVAAWQNFGTGRIPPRPFFSNLVIEKAESWGKALAINLEATGFDAEKALSLVGMGIKGQLQEAIVNTNAPPLSETTLILRERFWGNRSEITGPDVWEAMRLAAGGYKAQVSGTQAKPLIWTGHMQNSVDFEVSGL